MAGQHLRWNPHGPSKGQFQLTEFIKYSKYTRVFRSFASFRLSVADRFSVLFTSHIRASLLNSHNITFTIIVWLPIVRALIEIYFIWCSTNQSQNRRAKKKKKKTKKNASQVMLLPHFFLLYFLSVWFSLRISLSFCWIAPTKLLCSCTVRWSLVIF